MPPRLVQAAADLFLPLRCAGCGAFDTALCGPCEASLQPATGQGRCRHCSARWDGADFCPRCFHLQHLAGVRAAFEMAGPARKLVHDLKYRYYRAIAPVMGRLLTEALPGLSFDACFVVPLHRSRLRERGFNQSELLLRNTPLPQPSPGLARVRRTDRQVGQRIAERRTNVAGAFVYAGPSLSGQSVALIDDVVTTGATVHECALVLRDAGAREVWAVAFARASYEPATTAPIDD
ncbi:MAG: ComF family protein [Chloroflexi bacterium]|nr:ComF family protein [Chloroflexota bacterium]PWB44428.1 MAG: ComF family protein [Dehalococcoidia bacterium]